jgi:hypothetical protein
VISILKIKCNLSFHWELVDCKLLRDQWLRAQVCGVANIHRVEICCIGSRGTSGEFVSVSQVIFTPIVLFIEKIGPHPTSIILCNSNSAQTCKLKMKAFLFYKNIQTLHGARFEYFEQLSQLG